MSKYIKLEDASKVLENTIRIMQGFEENLETSLADLPTIEVSEDAISREYIMGYAFATESFDLPVVSVRDIEDAPSVAPQVPSEDCVDRYSVLAELDPRSYEYKVVKELPSVIPKQKEGEWIVDMPNYKSICPVCGAKESEFIYGTEMWYGIGESKFCPNCGAKMKGAGE